jgi:hypothetical protein
MPNMTAIQTLITATSNQGLTSLVFVFSDIFHRKFLFEIFHEKNSTAAISRNFVVVLLKCFSDSYLIV